jgi:DNA-directed RNA polymerase alpha subunit
MTRDEITRMDLRDYLAAKAVQLLWEVGPEKFEKRAKKENKDPADCAAETAYYLADAMMKARERVHETVVDEGIASLELTVRAENCLKGAGVFTITQLVGYTVNNLLMLPNLGRKSLKEIIEKLEARGLKLKEKNT